MWPCPWSEEAGICALHIVSLWLKFLLRSFNFLKSLQEIQSGRTDDQGHMIICPVEHMKSNSDIEHIAITLNITHEDVWYLCSNLVLEGIYPYMKFYVCFFQGLGVIVQTNSNYENKLGYGSYKCYGPLLTIVLLFMSLINIWSLFYLLFEVKYQWFRQQLNIKINKGHLF